ncbi:MAG: polyamine ABC transporter substrate-binding protein [Pseudomonadota bacterium]
MIQRVIFSVILSFYATCAFAQDKTLKIYNWSDYINPDVIAAFEKESGIKVIYDTYDSVEMAETKLTAGKSGYDLAVVAATATLPRQIPLGLYQKIDLTKLKNAKNLWPEIAKRISVYDPGNQYSVNYMWGTTGIGYNTAKAKERGFAKVDSWSVVFDPEKIKKFADCGIFMLDATEEIFPAALNYLKLPPDSKSFDDLRKAADLLASIRPFVKKFHSSEYINSMANGDVCLVVGYSGDILQARDRANEAKKGVEISYSIPHEGAALWFDNFVIPKDAANADAAYAFIDFLNRPEMAAKNSNMLNFASGNLEAQKFVDKDILENPGIYPPADVMQMLFTVTPYDRKTQSAVNRMWTNIKANRKPY